MPTLKELYEALERADAAGDAESARELAAYIKGVQSGGFKEELIPLSTKEAPKNLDSSIFDIPISLGRGAVQGFRFIADSFGADNPVSNALRGTENYLADLMSAQAKADSAEIGRIMKEAEDKGVGDQLLAAIKALSIAPVDLLTQALGTAAPTIIGGLAGIALRGGTVAARAIGSGIGASMGAGVVKSTIYDAVEGALLEAGEDPKVAKAKAKEAQEYTGDNWGSILAGTALGGIAGITGIEKTLVGQFAAKQAAKETTKQIVAKETAKQTIFGAATREAIPEAAQAGQEQLAANLALQSEIDPRTNLPFDVPTFRGVAGQAALEGILGGGLGAGIEVATRTGKTPAVETTQLSDEERAVAESQLSPEEKTQAQLARQKAGQQALEEIKQDVGDELKAVDEKTKTAVEEYKSKKPKAPAKTEVTLEDIENQPTFDKQKMLGDAVRNNEISGAQTANLLTLAGSTSDVEFLALLEKAKEANKGVSGGSTDTGVGVEGGEQATRAPDTTGVETPDATGVAGVDKAVTPTEIREGVTPSAIEELSDEKLLAELSEFTPEEIAELKAEANAEFAGGKRQDTLYIGEDAAKKERLRKLLETARARGLMVPGAVPARTPAPAAAATPERTVQLDEKGNVTSAENELAGKEFLKKVKQQYDVMRQDRTMVEETTVEELEADEAPPPKKKRKALPDWEGLTPDEQQVYLDGLGEPTDPINSALTNLIAYRKLKSQITPKEEKEWPRNDAMAAYEINRVAEGRARNFAFPSWINLSEEQRNAFTSVVPKGKKVDLPPTGELIQRGFNALAGTLGPEAAIDKARMQETVAVSESGAKAKAKAASEMRGTEEDQLSLSQVLPSDLIDLIKNPDVDGKEKTQELLKYLRKFAQGAPYGRQAGFFDKVTSQINKMVAGTLLAENLNTKIEYVDSNDIIATYNARTDTILLSNRGLNEVAVLHELTHAATVKTISDVLSGKEKDPAKVEAVRRLKLLMNYSKKTLGGKYRIENGKRIVVSEGYNRAYQNIYEFIAYGMTDPKFQAELRKITVPQEFVKYSDYKGDSAWGAFVQLVADTIGLFNRIAEKVISGAPGVKSIFKLYDPGFLRGKAKEEAEPVPIDMQDFAAESDLPTPDQSHPLIRAIDNANEKYALIAQEIRQVAEKNTKEYEIEFKKTVGKDPQKKDYDNPPKDSGIVPLRKRINTETNKLRTQLNKAQTEILNINKQLRDEGLEVFEIDLTQAEEDVGVNKSITPGYLGNLFLEVAGIFDVIASAPPEGGVVLSQNNPEKEILYAGKPRALPTQSPVQQKVEARARLIKRVEENNKGAFNKFGSIVKELFTKNGYRNAVRKVQNRLVVFSDKEKELDRLGKLVMVGTDNTKRDDEINDISTAYDSAMGIAQNYSNEFKEFTENAIESVRAIMQATKKSYAETLADLQMYMTGMHDFERRMELFYRNVPLTDAADTKRQRIFEELSGKLLIDLREQDAKAADIIVKELKQDLVKLTTNFSNYPTGIDAEKLTPGGYMYNPLGYDIDVAIEFKDTYKNANPEVKAELEKLFGTDSKPGLLKQIIDKSAELNREANYFTDAVENVIKFYGYKHYFPFKGKGDTDTASKLDMADPFTSERLGGDFKQGEPTFMGRQTDADNPFLQVFTEATKSAMRAGFRDVPHTMKNLINQNEIAGSKKISVGDKGTVSFEERSKPGFKWSAIAGENDFFVYKKDGSVDVYEINDPDMRRAFKGLYKDTSPLFDLANKITSKIGAFHTRYNPAFAPLDFVRNLMTYAGIVGLKFGPKTAGQLYAAMSKVIAQGGMHKTFIFTKAFTKGDKKALDAFKKSPEGSYYKDVSRYYELGGQVAYMDSLTNSQALESLAKELERNPKFSPKKWSTYFDAWMGMFETTSRVATFRTLKQKYMKDGIKKEEAEIRAMSVAKDLANFQQVGEIGKELGGLFMFWRPAATGAVKAIDALIPAFDFRSEKQLIEYYKTRPNVTDAQARRAAKVYGKEVENARYMSVVLAGSGYFMYEMAHMMAGDDEDDRNKVEIDDMARWVRFVRFNTGVEINGRDLVFQIPWGFGPGSIAAAGAQIAAVANGGQDWMRAGLNIASAGFESFVPLPISKIDPLLEPTKFLVDSVTPSVLRPLLQFSMNTDGLGRKIYTDRQSRYADAYLGGDNVPEFYKDIAKNLFDISSGAVDMSPNTAYFLANNYIDGLSRALSTTYNLTDVVRGQKEFDIRTDTFLLDSYFKAPSNYDAIEFSKVENKIKEFDARMKALKDTDNLGNFLETYPMVPSMVKFYNTTVNGSLRDLRAQATQVRKSKMTQKEKTEMLQMLNKQQNQIKRAFTNAVEGLETGYTGYEE